MGMLPALEGIFLDVLHDNDLNGKVIGPSHRTVKVPPSSKITRPSSIGPRISQIGNKIGHAQIKISLACPQKTLLFVTK